jgi:hypothetical protein
MTASRMLAAVPFPGRAPLPPSANPRQEAAGGTELLARILWAEAGMRSVRAIEALAALVANRAALAASGPAARLRFAPSAAVPAGRAALLAAVCRAPFLFACGNPRHPHHGLLATATEAPVLEVCRRIAARAASGALPDPTGGATHWHDMGELPRWALGEVPVAEIGGLVFYRLAG